MRQLLLKITVLLFALTGFVNISKALPPADSLVDKQAAAISKSLVTRIKENDRLIKAGKADQANYVIYNDDPSVFMHFTSDRARKLWVDKGLMGDWFSGEKSNEAPTTVKALNEWVSGLKKTYLNNTIYKDYNIYFVVSGVYNYANINAKEPGYDWTDVRAVSFHDTVKVDKGTITYTENEEKVLQGVFAKVQLASNNKELIPLLNKGKYIVFFIFNFYKYQGNIVAPFVAGKEGSEAGIKIQTYTTPNIFQINGHFYSDNTTRDLAREIEVYNNQHHGDMADVVGSIGGRQDYLSQLIRNVFMFFSTKTGGELAKMDCKSTVLRDRLYQLYKSPLNEGPTSIFETLKDFPFDTRKCLLEQMSTTTFCGDGNANLVSTNFCENLVLDLVVSTPPEQRKPLLEFLNANNKVLRRIIVDKIHDANKVAGINQGGLNNYKYVVHALSQFAFEVYKNDPSIAKDPNDLCEWYWYDPKANFNIYSKNTLATYNEDNTLDFEFRNYKGPCFNIPQLNYNGTGTTFVPLKFRKRPFEFVGIIPTADLSVKFMIDGKDAEDLRGKQLLVPALLLYWNIDRTKTTDAIEGLDHAFKMAGYFKAGEFFALMAPKFSKVYGQVNSLISKATAIAERSKRQDEEEKTGLAKALETYNTHKDLVEGVKEGYEESPSFETLVALYDVIKYWKEFGQVEHNYLDPDFPELSVPLTELEELLYENQLLSKDEIYARRNAIDVTFPPIRTEADYLAFRQFCVYDLKTTIEAAEGRWADSVALWRSDFGIGGSRNLALMKFGDKQFLLPSNPAYSTQMQRSTRFVPSSFYDDLKAGKRLFDVPKYSRDFDSEVIGFEYFARLHNAVKGGKYPGVTDEITIFSDLWTCPSCAGVFGQFRKMFPNVSFKIITNPKLHY